MPVMFQPREIDQGHGGAKMTGGPSTAAVMFFIILARRRRTFEIGQTIDSGYRRSRRRRDRRVSRPLNEVHESGGSTPSVETMIAELKAGTYRLPGGGTHTIAGPPGTTLASVQVPAYCFTVDGTDRKVTEACEEYLALLERRAISESW
jgi:hypothetical protein